MIVARRPGASLRRARIAAALGLVVGLACAWPACGPGGEPARLDFTLKDLNGRDVKLSDFKGKPLVVNFWATWCGPCQVETPELEALWQKYRAQGVTIVGVETESDPAVIRQFASDFKVTYPLLVGADRTDLEQALGWTGLLPTSVFVRANGTIAGRLEGLDSEAAWDRYIHGLF